MKDILGKECCILKYIYNALNQRFTYDHIENMLITFAKNRRIFYPFEQYSPFMISCQLDDKAAQAILKMVNRKTKKEMLNEKDQNGKTCLMHALKNIKNEKLISFILNLMDDSTKKEVVKVKDDFGQNVLMIAAQKTNAFELMKIILQKIDDETKKIIIQDKCYEGKTALDYFYENISNSENDQDFDLSKIKRLFLYKS